MASNKESPAVQLITPREADIGGFTVRRSLPTRGLKSVGPWVFFDHMGPAIMKPGHGMDVIAHPHINLATVTYLFDGQLVHRDSIGTVQTILPGAINLMMAGSGIAHSERTHPTPRAAGHTAHGLQLWLGLPAAVEEEPPAFFHYPADQLPGSTVSGASVRVMIGEAFGLASPVVTYSPTLYAEALLAAGATISLPTDVEELAVYAASGRVKISGIPGNPETATDLTGPGMAVLPHEVYTASDASVLAVEESRLILIGGSPLGKRYMWWNFVSSRRDRIEQAMADWKEGRMAMVPGETEFTRLPESDGFAHMKD